MKYVILLVISTVSLYAQQWTNIPTTLSQIRNQTERWESKLYRSLTLAEINILKYDVWIRRELIKERNRTNPPPTKVIVYPTNAIVLAELDLAMKLLGKTNLSPAEITQVTTNTLARLQSKDPSKPREIGSIEVDAEP